jgi:membrane protease YdiL (CAAX protease family)
VLCAVKRHPLIAYFLLSYTLTWLAWLPYVLSEHGLGLLPLRMPELLGSSQTSGVLPGAYLGPVTAAFVVTALVDGRAGLRRWAARLVRWRVNMRWYTGVLLVVPLVCVLATLPLPGASLHLPGLGVLAAYPVMLVMQFLTTGVAEEPGWRDFAQPRLQRRFGPLVGSLVLGPLWGAWHLPLFLTEWGGWPHVTWLMVAEFLGGTVLLSIVMTWVFNRTGESLPLIMLLHANVNSMFSLVWPELFPSLDPFADSLHVMAIGAGATAVLLLVATRGRLGLTSDTSPPRHSPSEPASPRTADTPPAHRRERPSRPSAGS